LIHHMEEEPSRTLMPLEQFLKPKDRRKPPPPVRPNYPNITGLRWTDSATVGEQFGVLDRSRRKNQIKVWCTMEQDWPPP
jgi:hypothetical protein